MFNHQINTKQKYPFGDSSLVKNSSCQPCSSPMALGPAHTATKSTNHRFCTLHRFDVQLYVLRGVCLGPHQGMRVCDWTMAMSDLPRALNTEVYIQIAIPYTSLHVANAVVNIYASASCLCSSGIIYVWIYSIIPVTSGEQFIMSSALQSDF